MTDSSTRTRATKRRQHLLLAGLVAAIAGITAASVWLTTDTNANNPQNAKPVTTHILTPGAQVDPKDAWRGQADAQLKAIEQKSRELGDRHTELTTRSQDMLERLKRLEQAGLTPIPPAPVPGPIIKPDFGPDRHEATARDPLLQRLPPPPPPPVTAPSAIGTVTPPGQPLHPNGIVSITLADPTNTPANRTTKATETRTPTPAPKDTRRYLPSGSFTRALLLGGLDAPTGGQAQRNPQPVLLKLLDLAVLPNHFRTHIQECFVVGAGYGDVSAERAYIRTESLSCVTADGNAIDVPMKGYVAGEDGKAGLRGRLVTKQGQLLANALVAGVAGGIGQAFRQSATTMSVSPLGATSTVDPERQLQAGLGSGVGRAMDRLAQYYISLAEKVFPVIEVDAGRTVDVVVTQGLALGDTLTPDPQESDDDEAPIADRNPHRPTGQETDTDDD